MRRFGDLMNDLGFNKEAPIDSQKALFRHMARAANATRPAPKPLDQKPGEQLSFDPEILGTSVQKKTAGR